MTCAALLFIGLQHYYRVEMTMTRGRERKAEARRLCTSQIPCFHFHYVFAVSIGSLSMLRTQSILVPVETVR